MAYLNAWKSTEKGQAQWQVLEEHSATFKWEKGDLEGDTLGQVHGYQVDSDSKELTQATITLDPEFFEKDPVPSGKKGYEDAKDHGSRKANRVAGIGHEAEHGVFATEPGVAEKLVAAESLNKEIKEAFDSLPLDEYQRVYSEEFKQENEKNQVENEKNEQRATAAGNKVGEQFKEIPWSSRRQMFKDKD